MNTFPSNEIELCTSIPNSLNQVLNLATVPASPSPPFKIPHHAATGALEHVSSLELSLSLF